ncbi:type II toxin-antitoxin system ParD family antitoxin [Dolichospermum sp. UHCC 0259]|uniref:type II toxin-antitoxin system ParD family antitoxin n=1 Tax=Dolichospermum sp. UHCC 0259 TaxID=2590010 RepID=UPI00144665E6|nr:type II toxin-antitoxin system ParD family antitoxin [Dolichospermum sp. UHCC 0259]MTJ49598.1 type II toxin-antitoxin system ParD family antitoxin [Dolichospermum sp. UHCC 0259]
MNIQIKSETEELIQAYIETGRFKNIEDAVNEAFSLLLDRERRLEELREKIAVGTQQIKNGQVTDGEVVFARLQAKIGVV